MGWNKAIDQSLLQEIVENLFKGKIHILFILPLKFPSNMLFFELIFFQIISFSLC